MVSVSIWSPLEANGGEPEFEPDDFCLRVENNVYGEASAGKIWYDHVSNYLLKTASSYGQQLTDAYSFVVTSSRAKAAYVSLYYTWTPSCSLEILN